MCDRLYTYFQSADFRYLLAYHSLGKAFDIQSPILFQKSANDIQFKCINQLELLKSDNGGLNCYHSYFEFYVYMKI